MATVIESEFNSNELNNWFFKKDKKFLHNIDTFYYSVSYHNDFTKESNDTNVSSYRNFFDSLAAECINFDSALEFRLPGTEDIQLLYTTQSFAGYYNNCISCPDRFDIFLATKTPTDVTSEILVQLRSMPLWLDGVNSIFEYSMRVINAITKYFNLDIYEVKENRVDYCWHTNCIQSPEKYFRIDNFSEMQVSRYKRINYQYQFTTNGNYENDYISLGRRSDKCFVRMYLKTKEVVEQGYKPWFFNIWYFNNLINRFDYYVLSNLYELRNWKYIDIIRLQFYSEYGSDERLIQKCNSYMKTLAQSGTVNFDAVQKLADSLTPKVTIIMNVEFQTTRKSSKSYCLIEYERNSKYGPCKRIYDYLDNRRLITEYLTHSTLRLVDITTDNNKSRCEYTQFWSLLRRTKQIDVKKMNINKHMTRIYTRNLDMNLMKKRYIHTAVTLSLYKNGISDSGFNSFDSDQEDNLKQDLIDNIVMLNDNDIHAAFNYKVKRSKQLNHQDFKHPLEEKNV